MKLPQLIQLFISSFPQLIFCGTAEQLLLRSKLLVELKVPEGTDSPNAAISLVDLDVSPLRFPL